MGLELGPELGLELGPELRLKLGLRLGLGLRLKLGLRLGLRLGLGLRWGLGLGLCVRSTRWSFTVEPDGEVRQWEEAVRQQLWDAGVAPGVAAERQLASQR